MIESAGGPATASVPADGADRIHLLPRSVPEPLFRRNKSSRQAQESAARRHAIVVRAVEVFARNGYTKTTLHAVGETVGLTRTGLLNHFQSKDGLFLATLEESERWAHRRGALGVEARGLAGIRTLAGFLGESEDGVWIHFVQMLRGEALHDDAPQQVRDVVARRTDQIKTYIVKRLAEAQADGELGAVPLDTLSDAVAAMINGLQMHLLLAPEADVRAAFNVFVDGLEGHASP